MMRRVILGICAIAALALTTPSWAGAVSCATFSDAKGDGALDGRPMADPALDITGVKFASTAKALVMTISLDKLSQRPTYAPGNRVQTTFTVKGREVVVYYKYSTTRAHEANVFYQQGIRVDGVFFSAAFEPSIKGNDVIMSVKYTELKSAVGSAVKGQKLTGLKAQALASYVATNQTWDTAEAPATLSSTAGVPCS